jgi:SulP family sulfate permease
MTAFSAVAISIEFCILIGVFLSFLLTVPRAGRMLLTEFVVAPDGGVHERLPEDPPCDRILIFGLEGELFFGASATLEGHFAAIEERITGKTQVLVLRVKRARNPDAVGMTLLERFIERVQARGIHVLLGGVRPEFYVKLQRTHLDRRLEGGIFLEQPVRQTSTMLAIEHAYSLIGERCPTCPRRSGTHARELHYEI